MASETVTIEIERDGQKSTATGLSPEDVANLVRAQEGERSVTVTIAGQGADQHLMVAVSSGNAFLGLKRADGLFQYVAHGEDLLGTEAFEIGGQQAHLSLRYVLGVDAAANVVEEWLRAGEGAPLIAWERQ